MACNMNIIEAIILLLLLLQTANSIRLATNSRWIVNEATGKRVKLTCANWAAHMEPMIPEGLEKQPVKYIATKIVETGFNCVRFTWPTFMFTRPGYGTHTVSQSLNILGLRDARAGIAKHNPQFLHMNLIDAQKAVVDELGNIGLMVVLDNTISDPKWCCSWDDGNGFFGDASFDPDEWLRGLALAADAYKSHPAVVAISLRNELRGDRENEADWYKYMRLGASDVHVVAPHLLVIVSGLSYDSNLGFLKSEPFGEDIGNKLVFEAHWYTFGTPAEQWKAQTNLVCASMTLHVEDNVLFLIRGNPSYPVFFSEYGIDQTGVNEADNRFIGCLLATIVENDLDWALWAFQGSYMLREGRVNMGESYGIMDFNWVRPKNPSFVQKLQFARQMSQGSNPRSPTSYYKIFHPATGLCVQLAPRTNLIYLSGCAMATRWDQHRHGGAIRPAGTQDQCLVVMGNNVPAKVSRDCTSDRSKWKIVSASRLHLAAQNGEWGHLCLHKNDYENIIYTAKCLCVGDDLADLHTCAENPQRQWFRFVHVTVDEFPIQTGNLTNY
ncbi:glycosyl hydrolase 5 family protein-like [Henckelia pumila]|uniref:glycosyl hydrolase 5 family protein-like n=1 Tax=Henckelia pumila TaxID=405737 RepID=UPI003C6E497B